MINKQLLKSTLVLAMAIGSRGYAQTDSLAKVWQNQLATKKQEDTLKVKKQLYAALRSKQEDDWLTAMNFFYQIKESKVYDSAFTVVKVRFPEGKTVRNDEARKIYDEVDAAKKEALYQAWIKRFSPERLGGDRIVYDYARNAIGQAYANADNVSKAVEYANLVETPVWKGEGWAGVAASLLKKGHSAEAGILLKKAIANAEYYVNMPNPDNGARFAATGYPGYCATYASILYKAKQYDSALVYIEKAYQYKKSGDVVEMYVLILSENNKDAQAMGLLEQLFKDGKISAQSEAQLKKLYVKVKGSEAGYDTYLAGLNEEMVKNIRAKAEKEMISEPAAMFTLKDLDGNVVSMAALKGKVVVLDFWATWCGPCKRSFPAMKMAVEKYKNDAEIAYLFIDTWEHTNDASQAVSSFIKGNQYPFQVLLDAKDPATGVCKVVESYGVKGIPAKFIVDKNGNIRFKLTGFEGSNEGAVAELSAMIELARKG